MALIDIVRSGVALANKITSDGKLQSDVTWEAANGLPDGAGAQELLEAVTIKAIVIKEQKLVRTASGELVQSTARLTILDPSIVVSLYDKFTLADGSTGPILNTGGFIDGGTSAPLLTDIYLG